MKRKLSIAWGLRNSLNIKDKYQNKQTRYKETLSSRDTIRNRKRYLNTHTHTHTHTHTRTHKYFNRRRRTFLRKIRFLTHDTSTRHFVNNQRIEALSENVFVETHITQNLPS